MPARSPSEDLGRSLWAGAVLPEKRARSSHPRPRATRVPCDAAGDLPVTLERIAHQRMLTPRIAIRLRTLHRR